MKRVIDFSKDSIMEIGSGSHCIIQQVQPENVFTFPAGILGFEAIKEYVFLLNEKVAPFLFMQSLDASNLSFVCIETFLIKPDYSIKLPEACVDTLKLQSPSDALILSLVTVNSDIREFTANLMSPVVVNMRNSIAMQYIPDQSEYPVRFNIWEALEQLQKAESRVG